ncbi:MAG: hypothetical protein ACU85V_05355 [Gammaproteobacteria bacterium]
MPEPPTASVDPPQRFADFFAAQFGEHLLGVILYGSWLRGNRDTVLDFYVLLDSYTALPSRLQAIGNRLLPPNVYTAVIDDAAAKYATVTLSDFERACERDFHSYFWARFAQPSEILRCRNEDVLARIERAKAAAAERMVVETAPLLPAGFSTETLWTRAFALTYACELRSEDTSRAQALVQGYATYLQHATESVAAAGRLRAGADGRWQAAMSVDPARARARWSRRRQLGKCLSILRLLKAAFTFDEPLAYVLWKVERHSGVRESASPLQHRYPLLFAWPVLWRLWRRGGFR